MKILAKYLKLRRKYKYWIYPLVFITGIGVIYTLNNHFDLELLKKAEYFRLSMHLREDTEALQMVIYKYYDINHEQILKTGGSLESFLGLCRRNDDCKLLRRHYAIRACKDIISSSTFDTFRVYHCWTKPNLEFTNRLKCRALTFSDFKQSCRLGYKIAQT